MPTFFFFGTDKIPRKKDRETIRNKVILAGGSADEAYGAEGWALAASKNSVNLTAGTFHKLYGAVAEDGNLSENTVIMTGGAVGEVYGAKTGGGDLTQNTVTITGGTADKVYGAEHYSGNAVHNAVVIGGQAEINQVYGLNEALGKATNTSVTITDHAVVNTVYGAYISGDTLIRGNVYTGYSDNGAVNGNRVYITGDTQVQGSVYGFQGSDVILVGSSKGIKVNADQGDDLIYSLSANNYLNGHYGSDTFIIDWRKAGGVTVYDTPNGGDVNTVKLVNGSAATISASKSGNHLLLTNGAGDTLTLSNWSYGTYDSLQLVSDSGVTTYSRSALDAALNSLGTATLQFSDTSLAANAVVTALTEQDKQHLLIVSGNF